MIGTDYQSLRRQYADAVSAAEYVYLREPVKSSLLVRIIKKTILWAFILVVLALFFVLLLIM